MPSAYAAAPDQGQGNHLCGWWCGGLRAVARPSPTGNLLGPVQPEGPNEVPVRRGHVPLRGVSGCFPQRAPRFMGRREGVVVWAQHAEDDPAAVSATRARSAVRLLAPIATLASSLATSIESPMHRLRARPAAPASGLPRLLGFRSATPWTTRLPDPSSPACRPSSWTVGSWSNRHQLAQASSNGSKRAQPRRRHSVSAPQPRPVRSRPHGASEGA